MARSSSRPGGSAGRGGAGNNRGGQFGRGGAPAGRYTGKPAGNQRGGKPAGKPAGKSAGRPGSKPTGNRGAGKPAYAAASQPGRPPRKQGPSRSDLIEGRRAVEEALASGMPLVSAMVCNPTGEKDANLDRLVAALAQDGVEIERVSRARLDGLSSHGAHQGIIVQTKPFSYSNLSDIIKRAGDGNALVIVLDHVTDEGNFGAIVRTAEVVGAAGVVIAKARAASVGVGAYKTSAGAVLHIPIAQVPNLGRALDELKQAGFWACASTEHAHDSVWDAPMDGRVALVMGSEGDGISRLVLEKCDFAAKLPQRGRVESLNVAQATTVMAYEWLRRQMQGGPANA